MWLALYREEKDLLKQKAGRLSRQAKVTCPVVFQSHVAQPSLQKRESFTQTKSRSIDGGQVFNTL